MKNPHLWKETKFITDDNGQLLPNPEYVNVSSELVVSIIASLYQESIENHVSGTLLDLGCGTVPFYDLYKDLADEIICIDWDESHHKNIHLDYNADLNKAIPLDSASVDTVLLADVLEHICEPEILFKEVGNVLRQDGILILGVPFFYWIHETPHDYHRYTKYRLNDLCTKNNLEVLEIEEWAGPLSILLDITGKIIPKQRFQRIFQRFAIRFLNSSIGQKIDGKQAERFPLGYLLVAKKSRE